ncbi:hypothetical protein G7046_g8727 [Stylonectria norvegica]|nr:hypothetical protein G7046_g8727 [Stylonectria norvegica]
MRTPQGQSHQRMELRAAWGSASAVSNVDPYSRNEPLHSLVMAVVQGEARAVAVTSAGHNGVNASFGRLAGPSLTSHEPTNYPGAMAHPPHGNGEGRVLVLA